MRSRSLALSFIILAATTTLAGCIAFDRGTRVTEDRPIVGVTAVELATSGDLTVTVGTTPSLTVTAPDTVIGSLTSEVVDGVLRLGFRDEPATWSSPIRYELTVTSLESITVLDSGDAVVDFAGSTAPEITASGSGEVRATGISASTASVVVDGSGDVILGSVSLDELTVRMHDSGSVTVAGTAARVDADLDGSGDLDAAALRSEVSRVAIEDSGEAQIDVRDSLDARIDGSGDLVYSGEPQVVKSVSGSGELLRR